MRSWLGIPISWGAIFLAMTLLWFAMRAVMSVGGACGEGATPYEIATPCPDGVPPAMLLAITLAVLGIGGYFWASAGSSIGNATLLLLCWPVLFTSLGGNFLQLGLQPPGEASAPAWGWLVCGVLFLGMGLGPLMLLVRSGPNRQRRRSLDREADRTRGERRRDAELRLAEVDRLRASGVLDEQQHRDRRQAIIATTPPELSSAATRRLVATIHVAASIAGIAAGVLVWAALG